MDYADIQLQDSGVWNTYVRCSTDSQIILNEMKMLKERFPDYRVRAIDVKTGRMIDMM